MQIVRSNVTLSVPARLKEQAIERGIPFSRTLEEALKEKIEALEREKLAGIPAPEHPQSQTPDKGVISC